MRILTEIFTLRKSFIAQKKKLTSAIKEVAHINASTASSGSRQQRGKMMKIDAGMNNRKLVDKYVELLELITELRVENKMLKAHNVTLTELVLKGNKNED